MENNAVKIVRLKDVAEARLGYPFRGAIKDVTNGDAAVVQIKNVDPEQGIDWGELVKAKLSGRKEPDWLRAGDVLFAARGNRNVAVFVDQVPGRTVCAPLFYVLRMRSDAVLPAYLAWYINEAPAQRYFSQAAEGTFITSIRRAVLEALAVPVPSRDRQELIAKLVAAAQREKKLTKKLIRNREHQLKIIARGLIE